MFLEQNYHFVLPVEWLYRADFCRRCRGQGAAHWKQVLYGAAFGSVAELPIGRRNCYA